MRALTDIFLLNDSLHRTLWRLSVASLLYLACVCQSVCSPSVDKLAEDLLHLRVLLAHIIKDLLDHLVSLTLLLKDGTRLVVLHLRLEAVY